MQVLPEAVPLALQQASDPRNCRLLPRSLQGRYMRQYRLSLLSFFVLGHQTGGRDRHRIRLLRLCSTSGEHDGGCIWDTHSSSAAIQAAHPQQNQWCHPGAHVPVGHVPKLLPLSHQQRQVLPCFCSCCGFHPLPTSFLLFPVIGGVVCSAQGQDDYVHRKTEAGT